MSDILLSNGVSMPSVGCGTWTYNNRSAEKNVLLAFQAGYRLIDTAEYYRNERGVGKALKQCGLNRDEVFINSKVWSSHYGYRKTRKAFFRSMKRLGVDYLDSYLIHWPAADQKHRNWRELNAETWRALEDLYKEGLVRVIGVSNFTPKYLEALAETAEITPMVNQIEFHPGFCPMNTVTYCQEHGIALQAWSPFGRGEVFQHEVLKDIAAKAGKTPAQVCLRWILQHGLNPIIKAASLSHLENNRQVFDFTLSDEDMKRMDEIPFFGKLGYDADNF